jgi:hypothetical protein
MAAPEPTAEAALIRAREAEDRFWSSGGDSEQDRRVRDQAVADAVAAGMSMEQLADELGVRLAEIARMARSADHPPVRRDVGPV